jgi:hypothetical protein
MNRSTKIDDGGNYRDGTLESGSRALSVLLALALALTMALTMGAGCSDDSTAANNGGRNGAPDASPDGISSTDSGDAASDATSPSDIGGRDATDAADTASDAPEDAGDASDATDTADDATDAADATDDAGDATADVTPAPKGCTGTATVGTNYTLDTTGPAGQFYSRAAFDGDGVWVSYARPESMGAGEEDVYALRVLCDGTTGVGPIQVNTSAAGIRDYHPSVDVQDGTVYVAWTTEDPSTGVKTVSYRTYQTDGTPIMTASADVTPQSTDGSPISEMIWETDVAGLPDGGAIVVASYGSERTDYGFQVVVQHVDVNGNLVGSAVDAYSTTQADQKTPMVAARSLSDVWVSWTRSEGFAGPANVVYRTIDMTNPQQVAPSAVASNQTMSPGAPAPFGEPLASSGEVFVAHNAASYGVRLTSLGTATASDIQASPSGGYHLRPSIATGPGGGMLAWYKADPSPVTNAVIVQPFTYSAAAGVSAGAEKTVPLNDPSHAARAPYGPSIVHVGGDIYFVMWSEGPQANQSRLVGRFVQP